MSQPDAMPVNVTCGAMVPGGGAPAMMPGVRRRLCPRAGGVCVEVDLSPDGRCQFDCVYCSEDRRGRPEPAPLDVPQLIQQLTVELEAVGHEGLWDDESAAGFRHVSISGGGEPTFSPAFVEATAGVFHLRAMNRFPFFKVALLTNGVALDDPEVARTLRLFCQRDEIWIKLDAGTPGWMDRVNRPCEPAFDRVVANIIHLGRQRPVVIQSLFPQLATGGPPSGEIEAHAQLLRHMSEEGAQISRVQIYSVSCLPADPSVSCGHLTLRALSEIARTVRGISGLPVDVH